VKSKRLGGIVRGDVACRLWWKCGHSLNAKEIWHCRQGAQQLVICDYVGSQQEGPVHASIGNDSSPEGCG
jgi:hypothetical protein